MTELRFQSTGYTDDHRLDFGIRDIEVVQQGNQFAVFASSGSFGGLSSYTLDTRGNLEATDTALYRPSDGLSLSVGISIAESQDGFEILMSGHGAERIGTYDVNIAGDIVQSADLSGIQVGSGAIANTVSHEDFVFTSSPWETGVTLYDRNENSLTRLSGRDDGPTNHAVGINEMVMMHVQGRDFLITSAQGYTQQGWSPDEAGLSSYQVVSGTTNTGAPNSESMSNSNGILIPTDIVAAETSGQEFLVVASARENTGVLSVYELDISGRFSLVDQVTDTRDTRFGAAQAVDAVVVEGRTFIAAGGGDDGISLFTMTGTGQLVHIHSFADTLQSGLNGIQDLALAFDQGNLHVFASSQGDAGLTQLTFDISNLGVQTSQSGTIAGTAGDDMLIGDETSQIISGGAGHDILIDGAGSDTLQGGAGIDTFVLNQDSARDVISDFDVRNDMLDLSNWSYFPSSSALTLTRIPQNGVRIQWLDETVDLYSSDNEQMDLEEVRNVIAGGPSRVTAAPIVDIEGSNNADTLRGDWAADTLRGLNGNDRLEGREGSDELDGGAGNDVLIGDLGGDTLIGGAGNDTLWGGADDDTLIGGQGDDRIEGGGGVDVAVINTGTVLSVRQLAADVWQIETDHGRDTLVGIEEVEIADVTLSIEDLPSLIEGVRFMGDATANLYEGSMGDDSIEGMGGADTLFGDQGDDYLAGGLNNDRLLGGAGNDTLEGGDGEDALFGEDDHDVLYGDQGNDTLDGGLGDDRLFGGNNDDWLYGGAGNDLLQAGGGRDYLEGGAGADTLQGANGRDTAVYENSNAAITIDLANGIVEGGHADGDVLLNIEDVFGTFYADSMIGDGGSNTFFGDHGNDTLIGGAGSLRDVLYGGAHHDTIDGGAGNDIVHGGGGRDILNAGSGRDFLVGGVGTDHLTGGAGRDVFIFQRNWGNDTISDWQDGLDRARIVTGRDASDAILTQVGSDVLFEIRGLSDTILFENVTLAELNAFSSDFVFI